MKETNELQEKIESTIITKTFNVSGMPLKQWEKVNAFCKDKYADCRWVMIVDLINYVEEDFKIKMLWEELQKVKENVHNLKEKEGLPKAKPKVPTFGKKEGE